jgi:hypothetical protein
VRSVGGGRVVSVVCVRDSPDEQHARPVAAGSAVSCVTTTHDMHPQPRSAPTSLSLTPDERDPGDRLGQLQADLPKRVDVVGGALDAEELGHVLFDKVLGVF